MLPIGAVERSSMIDLKNCKRERFWRLARSGRLCVLMAALALAGCSTALPSLIDDEPIGSIKPKASPLSAAYDPRDWRIAEPVLASSLRGPGGAAPAIWSDADTGAHGQFLALAEPFDRNGQSCRTFVAQLVDGKAAKKLKAVGCPDDSGEVAIFDATVWTRL